MVGVMNAIPWQLLELPRKTKIVKPMIQDRQTTPFLAGRRRSANSLSSSSIPLFNILFLHAEYHHKKSSNLSLAGTSPPGARFVKARAVNHDKNCVFPWILLQTEQQVKKSGEKGVAVMPFNKYGNIDHPIHQETGNFSYLSVGDVILRN